MISVFMYSCLPTDLPTCTRYGAFETLEPRSQNAKVFLAFVYQATWYCMETLEQASSHLVASALTRSDPLFLHESSPGFAAERRSTDR